MDTQKVLVIGGAVFIGTNPGWVFGGLLWPGPHTLMRTINSVQ